jgi:acetyl-CoA carboxylase carboxyl transferase alpha subunit
MVKAGKGNDDMQVIHNSKNPNAAKSKSWECVRNARMQSRPQARDYIKKLADEFFEVKGDRCLGNDDAIVTGVGRIMGRSFTIIGQHKGHTLEERKKCDFGMPHPAGYRKSMRAIGQAEKFNRPILCIIDTPGAFCGVEAEEQGQGTVIAEHLSFIAAAKVPVISIVIGEGGSGGALALAISDRLMVMENTYFSVITPEGCASILFKDASKAELAADSLALTPDDLLRLKIADHKIEEKSDFGLENMSYSVIKIKEKIEEYLKELDILSKEELINKRYKKMLDMKGFN